MGERKSESLQETKRDETQVSLCCWSHSNNLVETELHVFLFRYLHYDPDGELTRGTVFLVRTVLAVLLPVTSPWQRDTLVSGAPTVKFLRRTRLFACGRGGNRELLPWFDGPSWESSNQKTAGLDLDRPHDAVKTHPELQKSNAIWFHWAV